MELKVAVVRAEKLKLKTCAVREYDNNKAPTSSICPVGICLSLHLHLPLPMCVSTNVRCAYVCAAIAV